MVAVRFWRTDAALPNKKTHFVSQCPSSISNLELLSRLHNVFIIGKGSKAYISLPRDKGVKLSIAEERNKRLAAKAAA